MEELCFNDNNSSDRVFKSKFHLSVYNVTYSYVAAH
jgi:hypothetical protein